MASLIELAKAKNIESSQPKTWFDKLPIGVQSEITEAVYQLESTDLTIRNLFDACREKFQIKASEPSFRETVNRLKGANCEPDSERKTAAKRIRVKEAGKKSRK